MLEKIIGLVLLWMLIAGGLLVMYVRLMARQKTQARLADRRSADRNVSVSRLVSEMGFLQRWLYLAGYRSANAPSIFLLSTLGSATVGVLVVATLFLSGLQQALQAGVEVIPGGVGQMFLPLAMILPWFVGLVFALAPLLVVRRARQQRVEMIEQDLPLALELLATLSEAGLAFDGALSRILETRLGQRPLAWEFQTFQADLLAGRSRIESLRRLSQRVQISTVSIFVSALAQVEQIGMGLAQVLRRQADDMRHRRRERANAFAASLPVKCMLPLVMCFLPGLFVWTLGPFFIQLLRITDTFIQVRNF